MTFFLLGALVVFIPCLFITLHHRKECSTPPHPNPPKPSQWNASDYQSNSDYYQNLTSIHDFSQLDNLRLDQLSWPRFCFGDGYKIIYLRKQYHMPDLNGSTTTLHYFDLINSLTTVQLTRPIWGIHDQQVRT